MTLRELFNKILDTDITIFLALLISIIVYIGLPVMTYIYLKDLINKWQQKTFFNRAINIFYIIILMIGNFVIYGVLFENKIRPSL